MKRRLQEARANKDFATLNRLKADVRKTAMRGLMRLDARVLREMAKAPAGLAAACAKLELFLRGAK